MGELTLYRKHRGPAVIFKKTWPDKPPSPSQQRRRNLFRDATAAWREKTPTQRAAWKTAARKLSLCMTGYDLYLALYLGPTAKPLNAIRALTGQTLTLP